MNITISDSEEKRDGFNPQQVIRTYVQNNSPYDLYNYASRYIYGQNETLRKAAILIYAHLHKLATGHYEKANHFLIISKSGTGKTTLCRAFRNVLNPIIPVFELSATGISPTAYRGASVEDWFDDEDFQKYGCAICFVDEIDKIMCNNECEDNYYRRLQESFLKMLDGGMLHGKNGSIDPSRVLFVGLGAFTPLREEKPQERLPIGFGAARETRIDPNATIITRDRLTETGGSEQFMGRWCAILQMDDIGEPVYRKVLQDCVDEIGEIFGNFGFSLSTQDRIVQEAMSSKYGLRGIRAAVWEAFLNQEQIMLQPESIISDPAEVDRMMEEIIPPHLKKMLST